MEPSQATQGYTFTEEYVFSYFGGRIEVPCVVTSTYIRKGFGRASGTLDFSQMTIDGSLRGGFFPKVFDNPISGRDRPEIRKHARQTARGIGLGIIKHLRSDGKLVF